MRASGSNDVLYDNCVIPDEMFFEESEWGELDEGLLVIGTAGNLGLLGAFVGIAEAARAIRRRPASETHEAADGQTSRRTSRDPARDGRARNWTEHMPRAPLVDGIARRPGPHRPSRDVGLDRRPARAHGRVPVIEARRAAHRDRRRRQSAPAERRCRLLERQPAVALGIATSAPDRSCNRCLPTTRTNTSARSRSVSVQPSKTDPRAIRSRPCTRPGTTKSKPLRLSQPRDT